VHADSILGYYEGSATAEIRAAFFARCIVLVEGRTESLSLPGLMARAGFETDRMGVAIVSTEGKGNLSKWWRLFTAYDIPCFIIFDNDSKDDGNGARREAALSCLGVAPDAQPALLASGDPIIGNGYAIMGGDYEQTMRSEYPTYATLEGQASGAIGDSSKPLTAQWVAQRLNVGSDGLVHRLAAAIASHAGMDWQAPGTGATEEWPAAKLGQEGDHEPPFAGDDPFGDGSFDDDDFEPF
jgi:putative ATP-dependent endonuclease of OLD family